MDGFALATAKRSWFVEGFMVWGTPGLGTIEYLADENMGGSDVGVYFGQQDFTSGSQNVAFADLRDHRGNALPATLTAPRVLIRPRTTVPVYLVGTESAEGFAIARDESAVGPVPVDLLIIEMGA